VGIDEKSQGHDQEKDHRKKNQLNHQNEERKLPSKDDIARIWADEKPAVRNLQFELGRKESMQESLKRLNAN
jgi:hypothetical protein